MSPQLDIQKGLYKGDYPWMWHISESNALLCTLDTEYLSSSWEVVHLQRRGSHYSIHRRLSVNQNANLLIPKRIRIGSWLMSPFFIEWKLHRKLDCNPQMLGEQKQLIRKYYSQCHHSEMAAFIYSQHTGSSLYLLNHLILFLTH